MRPFHLVLADEHRLVRSALREQFTQTMDVWSVTEASTLEEMLQAVHGQPPDVAIIDIEMIGHTNVCIQQVSALCAAIPVIFLSTQDCDVYLAFAWNVGAWAFVCKTVMIDELIKIVRKCGDGLRAFTSSQHERIHSWQMSVEAKLQALTYRQKDVLKLLVMGYTNTEIAETLKISTKTVEAHISKIFDKLDVSSRREIIDWVKETQVSVLWD